MYYATYGLIAILILIIVNQDILSGNTVSDNPAWKIYRRFLFAVMAYYITDILWGFFEAGGMAPALFADTTVYFAAMAVGISFWVQYMTAYLDEKKTVERFIVICGRLIAGLIIVFAAINIFTPVLFIVDADCRYEALPPRYFLLIIQILFLIAISVHAIVSVLCGFAAAGREYRYKIMASFGVIMATFLSVQLLFPYLPVYSIAYMLGTCMMHSFVANDEKEEYRSEQVMAKKMAELKDRFFSLLNNMPGMTFTKDAKTGVYLACNQAFASYAHKESPEGVVGLTDAEIFDPQTAAHFVEDDRIACSLTKPYIFYEEVLDAAGEQRRLQTTKLKYTDTQGRLCVLGMCQDVTDMVRIQHEQAKTREAYESAVSTGLMYNHIAQTLARDYTEMFYVNTDTEEFTEYRSSAEGGSFSEVRRGWHFFSDCRMELAGSVYPDDREVFLSAMQRKTLMKTLDLKDTFVMTYRRREGLRSGSADPAGRPEERSDRYFKMKVSRMENDEHYIIVGFMDVDAEMREAMCKSEALAEAISSAEAANRARYSFISGMSHEICTPMNAIIGLDSMALKSNNLDPETRHYLEKIGTSAEQLLSLINDILEISRIESGRVQLHNGEFSFSAVMDQINAMFESQCREKGLTYECHVNGQAEEAYFGDDIKLKDVLINILSNAVRFTDAPGTVTLNADKVEENDGITTLRFKIRDTGIGMDCDFLPTVFDAFSREGAGKDGSNRGSSGLGLTITKRIVEMMKGSISVWSEKGVGTEFTVTVPLRRCEQSDANIMGGIDPETMYVLVVDDDPIEAEHARMVLEEVGIKADACTSGQEALRRLEIQHGKQKPYNLVLIDWNMPGMSGLETTQEIRRQFGDESSVVVLTAYNWDDIHDEAQRVGVKNFLPKPLYAGNILESFERIARRSNLSSLSEKKQANLTGRRILLAEDMELNAKILEHILGMEGISVDHAINGRIALELFEKSTAGIYAAILMDVRMPEMDGLEAAQAIRALEREDAKRIPIIALTANAFDEDVQRSMKAGMSAHLTKPVEADQLIRTLGELVYEAEVNGVITHRR